MCDDARRMARLLVVDDDPDIRAMFVRTLRSLGEVEEADSGAQAMRLLYAREFDLLLLDLHMPGLDGFTILETLTSKPGPNQDTPVFVATADVSDNARIRALRRHALFLLTKPVNLGTLRSFASSSLQKRMSKGPATPRGGKREGSGTGQGA
jgi:CheY-like chemotaxis protein